MKNRKRTLSGMLVGAALAVLVGPGTVRAEALPARGAPPAGPAEGRLDAGARTRAPEPPILQITGRVIHAWGEKPDPRTVLVIDGFTVLTRTEQLTARAGVAWIDDSKAKRTGRTTLGIYAETGVEYRKASGEVERYDSVYLVLETEGEVHLYSDGALRASAESTELFLRARKLRREYQEAGVREKPTGVIPAPQPPPKVAPPGVREAGVPKEITIVAQDDVRQVNFTSLVEDGMRISLWTGGVYILRGDMEMAADSVVIWTPESATRGALGSESAAKTAPGDAGDAPRPDAAPGDTPAAPLPEPAGLGPSRRLAAEAYLEGHVRVTMGRRVIQCSQLYYDFQREQALAIDTKVKTFSKTRNVPVYYYAKEVRQLARDTIIGTDAWMTTCEFAHPHYDMGADRIVLKDLTPAPGEEETPEHRRVRFLGENVQARVRELPLAWWPRMAGDVTEEATALRTLRIENSRSRGTGLVTQWHLLKLLGLEDRPKGFDFYFDLDFWGERGPGIGLESDYLRDDFYGQFLSYYLHDFGEDTVGSDDVEPEDRNRGRLLWRHRHYLPQDWELTLELSKISDRFFLNEFYEKEDEMYKTQESLVYLKKQKDDQALTLLGAWRLNDFQTQTEYLPQVGYNLIGRSLLDDRLTYMQDSEVAVARYRSAEWRKVFTPKTKYADRIRAKDSGATLVGDTIHEVSLPLRFGPLNVAPFAEFRASYFGDALDREGAEDRYAGREGLRAATQAWKVYDNVESDFWEVHGLKHIHVFDAQAYAAQSSLPSRDLIPFDVAEAGTPLVQGVDATGVTELGWRQRLETKRGPVGRRQVVDWLIMDLEATFYDNRISPRIAPDGKKAFNHLDHLVAWKATDVATVWTDTNYNLDRGGLDLFGFGVSLTHSPRLSYHLGQRIIPEADSSMTFVGFDYRLNEKWQLHVLQLYDVDRGQNAQSDFVLIRRLHRWLLRLRVELDPGEDDNFVGIEIQPVGAPEVLLRR